MTKEKKKTMAPKVRFPEFREAWTTKELGEIAVLINDKAGTNSYTLMSITAGTGLVSQIEKFGREIAGESYRNYYVIRKGDFAYNKSSTKQHPEGQIAMLEDEEIAAVPNSIFTCFRVNDKHVLPFFLKYPFSNNVHGNWLRKFIQVGARAHGALSVDTKDLFATPISFPSLPEQQKIAATLTSLDDLITAQSEKIKALQDHKKGLMQQLFPAEGERAPRVRFGEFEGSGEWGKNQLKKITNYVDYRGKTPSKSEMGVFLVTAKNIKAGYIDYENSKEYIPSELYESVMRKGKPKIGDVVITTEAPLGNVASIDREDIALAQRIIKLRGKVNMLDNSFLKHSLLSPSFQNKLHNNSTGSTAKGIKGSVLHNLILSFPSLSEQQKIAATLTSLDDLISSQHEKLEALKMQKKGLMQQLFPNPNDEAI